MVKTALSRRSPGDGSVYQLKNGKWVAVLDLGMGVNGKRNRSTKTTTSKVLAAKALREMQIRHRQNDLLSNQRKTLNQVASQWIEFYDALHSVTKHRNWIENRSYVGENQKQNTNNIFCVIKTNK